MNEGNLIPIAERSKEEVREIGRKGGIASGEARRKKKMMKDTLQMLLDLTLKDGDATDPDSIKNLADVSRANLTVDQAILLAQIKKAIKGDTSSAVFIRDTSGNKPAEEIKMDATVDNAIKEIESYIDSK